MKICVLLWAVEGKEAALADYETRVLTILEERYGGRVLQRLAVTGDGPAEVHVLEVPDEEALEAFLIDEERIALTPVRVAAISRTQLLRVEDR